MKNGVVLTGPKKTGIFWAIEQLRDKRHIVNVALAFIAIGLEIYYSICAGACSYLKGSIFGIDLQYIGIAYMTCLVLISILKRDTLLLCLISAGVGIEFYLIGFQVWHNTYCPYCMAFAVVVFILFVLNFRRDRKLLCIASLVLALILFAIFFKGSLAPVYFYTQTNPAERSYCGTIDVLL
ncbi:MAG: putative rane protein [Deltaproteobacteria bacterium]|nr:putative rane protein [Deltaproteobacteria bacterium]